MTGSALPPVAARPVFHVMLHGDLTGRKYGWARPAEVEAMLAAGGFGPGICPDAPPGSGDRILVPSPWDYWFGEALYTRHGRAADWAGTAVPHPWAYEAEMTFYLGAPMPHWLWSGQADYPLCVSHGRLARYKNLPRALVPWILDSRGFSELSQHGRWTISPEAYVAATIRYDEQIGGLQWAAPQDHMTEEAIIYGGMAGNVRCVGTRPFIDPSSRMTWNELVIEHQRLTTVNFLTLTGLWRRHRPRRPCPYIPVLQGDTPAAYLRHYRMYLDAGVALGDDYQLAGVGSVCRLQRMGKVAAVAQALGELNLGLHWFGLKLTGLGRPEIYRDLTSPFISAGTQSLDSEAWSLDARRKPRMPGCAHVYQRGRKTGLPSPCNNCFAAETEVVTRDGIKPIAELSGTTPELLVPRMGRNQGWQPRGDFVRAPVRELGKQRLWKIMLGRHRAVKIVFATAEHRWMLNPPDRRHRAPQRSRTPVCDWPEKTTAQLASGDQLRPLRAAVPARAQLMPWAAAQGFVFGDGTVGNDRRPAWLVICNNGKDGAMLPFFPFAEPVPCWAGKKISGLPRFWKDLPPIQESRTFLLSWLAGYFAADGTVSEDGKCILYSGDEQAVRFTRDVAAICGIGYSPARSQWRTGKGLVPTELWQINLRRRDLPRWFFLIKEHAVRATAADQHYARGTYWTVKSAEPTDRIETVYCATVPGAEMFGLADDLLTGNCPRYATWWRDRVLAAMAAAQESPARTLVQGELFAEPPGSALPAGCAPARPAALALPGTAARRARPDPRSRQDCLPLTWKEPA